jgi:hypothetical protein
MHLRGGCDNQGRPLHVQHIAEVIADRLEQFALDME